MLSNRTSFVILCEDVQQEIFARKYLVQRGVMRRKITPNVCPSGKQSGEQFVRDEFMKEVKTLRQTGRENRALIVVIDADTYSIQHRLEQLNDSLTSSKQKPRQKTERICIFVPKRNIETWIKFGQGQAVDEENSYPKLRKESDCSDAVRRLANEVCTKPLPHHAPSSLHHACEEIKRIL